MKPYTRKDYRHQLLTMILEAPLDDYKDTFSEEERFRLNVITSMTATQLEWLIDKEPQLFKKKQIQIGQKALDDFQSLKAWAFHLAQEGLDGVDQKAFYQALEHGATLDDIRALAKRYQLEIPRRIKKEEMVDIIIQRQKKAPSKSELMKKNTLALEQYAKEHHLDVAIELKKNDMIAYLADYLKEFKPATQSQEIKKVNPTPKASIELPDAHLSEIISRYQFPVKAVFQILISILILALLIGGTLWLMM